MGPHGRTLSVLVSILGAILLSTNFLPAGATLYINFVAAPGPVPVGGYLQFTTLLLNNVTAAPPSALNVTLSVTCSDSLIILPGATIQSPGCTTRVSVPPYPVGTPVGGPYPGCDPNPLSLVDLNAPASRPAYPTQVSADGHSAIWRNVILPGGARIPSALPFIGLVNYYQPIICLATVTPSSLLAADVIPNSLIGVTGTSRSYLKEGLVYTNVIPPPPPPPSPPGSSPAQFTGSYVTGVPTSTTTLIVIVIFVPIPPTAPPCRPGIVSDTRFTNTTTLVSNTTRCNTTEVRTVTNTTTCVPGGADVFVNTTTTTTTTCLVVDIFPNPTLAPNVTLPPNVTLAPNVTLPPNVTLAPNVTLPPNGTLAPIVTLPPNGTLAPNATDPPPNNGTQAPIQTSGPIVNATDPPVDNSTVPPVLILPTPTPSNTPQVTLPVSTTGFPTGGPIPTTDSPISTTAPPVSTTADPVATTAGPVFTTAPPLPTTEAPVATTAGPVATTASPVATTADPVATTASPVATTADPVATTGIPLPTL